jgi:tetratricopeptide (TPR) repeat protein
MGMIVWIRGRMKETLQGIRWPRFAWPSLAILILFGGCGTGPAMFIGARDGEINNSTQAIQSARNDVERGKAYSIRGAAYSEKARYSREFKLIPAAEYERLFDLAVKDHDEAIRLNPDSAEMYFNRAQAFYDRGTWDLVGQDSIDQKVGKPWLDRAAADFEKATEKDPGNDHAFDMLGLTHEQNREFDKAIRDYTQEMALKPWAQQRLADAYCDWGFRLQQEKNYAGAIAEYQKSIEFGTADEHSCPYEPYNALVAFYTTESPQYEKAWAMVHQAQKLKRRIEPEQLERLKKDSGRND